MSKNKLFTSPLGIGLGIGIGTSVGAIVIGAITYTILKYSKGKGGDGEGIDEGSRTSSMFSLDTDLDTDLDRDSSLSQDPLKGFKQNKAFERENDTNTNRIIRPRTGGKRSKKIKRKGNGKHKRTLKKV